MPGAGLEPARRLPSGSRGANATINRELAALKRGFRLAGKKVGQVPRFQMLQENNTRKGFFEPQQFQAVLKHLPEHLKLVFQVAYITGWRVPSEVLTRKWQQSISRRTGFVWTPENPKTAKDGCSHSPLNYATFFRSRWRRRASLRRRRSASFRGCFIAMASPSKTITARGMRRVVWLGCPIG